MPDKGKIWMWFFKFKARLLVAQCDRKTRKYIVVLSLIKRSAVLEQADKRLFLRFGPHSFAVYVGADGGNDAERKPKTSYLKYKNDCNDSYDGPKFLRY